ncbi:MAG: chemotaxis-specific protein-glutamate methyltransferase CheB [Bacteroidetes bacterium]|nr:chemotaxis-specific protein-glutamate methyltransferase CheB [Bacteroidota bacterium]
MAVKLLLVDDSIFMRNAIKKMLAVPEIEIIGTANNGKEAVEKNLSLHPDVILTDIEMPVMDGLEEIKQVMATNPTPIIVFSSLSKEGSEVTMKALEYGALDFVSKESTPQESSTAKDELIKKIVAWGSNKFVRANLKAKFSRSGHTQTAIQPEPKIVPKTQSLVSPNYTGNKRRPKAEDIKIVCIGISTGGPVALQEVIPAISANYPVPILIVQHMPPHFTASLANRLDQTSALKVVEAEDGIQLKPGTVYIAKGGYQMLVSKHDTLQVTDKIKGELFNPSVNVMVNSVVDVYKDKAVGIIMTGMGNDGQIALNNLNKAGGYVIAQSKDSCVVAGMPGSVIDNKIAHEVQPLHNIAGTISSFFHKKSETDSK